MGGLSLLFGGAMALVFVAGIALSEWLTDEQCTEGPCPQDMVRYGSLGIVVFIGLLWLIAAIAYEADQLRDSDPDDDRDLQA